MAYIDLYDYLKSGHDVPASQLTPETRSARGDTAVQHALNLQRAMLGLIGTHRRRTYRAGISQSCTTDFQKLHLVALDLKPGWGGFVMICRLHSQRFTSSRWPHATCYTCRARCIVDVVCSRTYSAHDATALITSERLSINSTACTVSTRRAGIEAWGRGSSSGAWERDCTASALHTAAHVFHTATKAGWQSGAETARSCQVQVARPARRGMPLESSGRSSPVMPVGAHAVRSMEGLWHRCSGIDAGINSRPDVAEPHAASPQP